MQEYDLVVVGGGTGNNVAAAGSERGLDVALVSEGPLGGTCLNTGCNPSKMLIQQAYRADAVREAGEFGVEASLGDVDVATRAAETEETLSAISDRMEQGYRDDPNVTLYRAKAEFVDDLTLEIEGEDERVRGETVVLAAGSRALVPPFDGVEETPYMTSTEALYSREHPDSLVVVGGGYIAAELGYYYEATGTEVTLVEMMDTLLPREDPDVAETFTELARERHAVHTGTRVTSVAGDADGVTVEAEGSTGDPVTVEADELLIAVGRRPNSDTLNLDAAGVETDDRGFVDTDDHLRTTADGVYAMGDLAGNYMFKHSADYETDVVVDNAIDGADRPVDYTGMGHAVFTKPQVAGVGETEDALQEAGREYVVGRTEYADTAMGRAMEYPPGFAKVLSAPDGEVLGVHIVGEEASTLIHEAIVALRSGAGTVDDVADAIYVHPALSKVVLRAFRDAQSKTE